MIPENALQLMRSRYSAYVLLDRDYLEYSWHIDYRPRDLVLEEKIRWVGLQIISHESQEDQAIVEFEACLLSSGKVEAIREHSRFVRQQGRWLYTDGDQLPSTIKPWSPSRNESCPCGSGKKFKRCCLIL